MVILPFYNVVWDGVTWHHHRPPLLFFFPLFFKMTNLVLRLEITWDVPNVNKDSNWILIKFKFEKEVSMFVNHCNRNWWVVGEHGGNVSGGVTNNLQNGHKREIRMWKPQDFQDTRRPLQFQGGCEIWWWYGLTLAIWVVSVVQVNPTSPPSQS